MAGEEPEEEEEEEDEEEEEVEYYYAGHISVVKKKGLEDRYFVLTADAFSYWEQEDDCEQGVQPRGFMSLPDITRFEEVENGFVLDIGSVKKPLHLQTPSDEELQIWCDTFRDLIGEQLGDNFIARPPAEEDVDGEPSGASRRESAEFEEEEEEEEEGVDDGAHSPVSTPGARPPPATAGRERSAPMLSAAAPETQASSDGRSRVGFPEDPMTSPWAIRLKGLGTWLKRKKRGYYWSSKWTCESCGTTQKENAQCVFRSTDKSRQLDLCEPCYARVVPMPTQEQALCMCMVELCYKKKTLPRFCALFPREVRLYKTIENFVNVKKPSESQVFTNTSTVSIGIAGEIVLTTHGTEIRMSPFGAERDEVIRWAAQLKVVCERTGASFKCDDFVRKEVEERQGRPPSEQPQPAVPAQSSSGFGALSSEAQTPTSRAGEAEDLPEGEDFDEAEEEEEEEEEEDEAEEERENEEPAEEEEEEAEEQADTASAPVTNGSFTASRGNSQRSVRIDAPSTQIQQVICEGPLQTTLNGKESVYCKLYADRFSISSTPNGKQLSAIYVKDVQELDILFSSFTITHSGGVETFEVPDDSLVDVDGWCEAFAPLFEGSEGDGGEAASGISGAEARGDAGFGAQVALGRVAFSHAPGDPDKKVREIYHLCADRQTQEVSKGSLFVVVRQSSLIADVFGIEADVEGGIGVIDATMLVCGVATRLDKPISFEDFKRFWEAWLQRRATAGSLSPFKNLGVAVGASTSSTPRAGLFSATASTVAPGSVSSRSGGSAALVQASPVSLDPATATPRAELRAPKPRPPDEKVMRRLMELPKRYSEACPKKPENLRSRLGILTGATSTSLQGMHGPAQAATLRDSHAPGSLTKARMAEKVNMRDPLAAAKSRDISDKVTGSSRSVPRVSVAHMSWAKITSSPTHTPAPTQRRSTSRPRSSSQGRSVAHRGLQAATATAAAPASARPGVGEALRQTISATPPSGRCARRTSSAPCGKITGGRGGVTPKRPSLSPKITEGSKCSLMAAHKAAHAGAVFKPLGH